MRKPVHGEIWKHRNGRICVIFDEYSHSAFKDAEARVPMQWGRSLSGWLPVATFDSLGRYSADANWDLSDLLDSIVNFNAQAPASPSGCKHDFIPSRDRHKGSRWCKACGEYAP